MDMIGFIGAEYWADSQKPKPFALIPHSWRCPWKVTALQGSPIPAPGRIFMVSELE